MGFIGETKAGPDFPIEAKCVVRLVHPSPDSPDIQDGLSGMREALVDLDAPFLPTRTKATDQTFSILVWNVLGHLGRMVQYMANCLQTVKIKRTVHVSLYMCAT